MKSGQSAEAAGRQVVLFALSAPASLLPVWDACSRPPIVTPPRSLRTTVCDGSYRRGRTRLASRRWRRQTGNGRQAGRGSGRIDFSTYRAEGDSPLLANFRSMGPILPDAAPNTIGPILSRFYLDLAARRKAGTRRQSISTSPQLWYRYAAWQQPVRHDRSREMGEGAPVRVARRASIEDLVPELCPHTGRVSLARPTGPSSMSSVSDDSSARAMDSATAAGHVWQGASRAAMARSVSSFLTGVQGLTLLLRPRNDIQLRTALWGRDQPRPGRGINNVSPSLPPGILSLARFAPVHCSPRAPAGCVWKEPCSCY